jgi:CubicO group peptidase (beta-lactamase class C family)
MRPRFALALLAAALALPPAIEAQDVVIASPLGARLDSLLRDAERRGFSGVVRIEKEGQLLLRQGYGLADRAARTPFTPATVVQIGSNTKDFTLVALLRLQAAGKLGLDDPLAKHFPGAPADKRAIALRQLVNHTAGFPIGLGGDFEPLDRDAFVRRALAAPLRAAPGTQEIYSNTGYALLAAVIEQVTGTSYERHVRDELLAPLGLRDTGFLLPGFDPKRLAHGYARGEDRGTMLDRPHAADGHHWNLRGNGGMLSTVDDMHRFYEALIPAERLVSFRDRGDRFDPRQPIALAGSDLVNFFLYERWPREGITLVLATNSDEARGPAIRRALAPLLGLPVERDEEARVAGPPPGAKEPPAELAAAVRGWFDAVNAADSLALHRFVEQRFVADDTPAAERVARFLSLRTRLGALAPSSLWLGPDGSVHAAVVTGEGPATFIFAVDDATPRRLRAVRIMVGG